MASAACGVDCEHSAALGVCSGDLAECLGGYHYQCCPFTKTTLLTSLQPMPYIANVKAQTVQLISRTTRLSAVWGTNLMPSEPGIHLTEVVLPPNIRRRGIGHP
jgi:hypothetical protein